MTLYTSLLKPVLFRMDPETVHNRVIRLGSFLGKSSLTQRMIRNFFAIQIKHLKQTLQAFILIILSDSLQDLTKTPNYTTFFLTLDLDLQNLAPSLESRAKETQNPDSFASPTNDPSSSTTACATSDAQHFHNTSNTHPFAFLSDSALPAQTDYSLAFTKAFKTIALHIFTCTLLAPTLPLTSVAPIMLMDNSSANQPTSHNS